MGGRVGGHMYDRQSCCEKRESVIPDVNYKKIIRVVIRMPAKNAKPLKLLLEGGGEKGM